MKSPTKVEAIYYQIVFFICSINLPPYVEVTTAKVLKIICNIMDGIIDLYLIVTYP